MATAYLGLGGNIGDSRASVREAIRKLGELGIVKAVSSLYETEPVGRSDQPWFLNCAVALDTALSPEELFEAVKNIEDDMGRKPAARNAPRRIDIDILLYDDLVLKTEALTIPHPRMHERRFVLEPLAAIAPGATHPALRKSVAGLLAELRDSHAVRKALD